MEYKMCFMPVLEFLMNHLLFIAKGLKFCWNFRQEELIRLEL